MMGTPAKRWKKRGGIPKTLRGNAPRGSASEIKRSRWTLGKNLQRAKDDKRGRVKEETVIFS